MAQLILSAASAAGKAGIGTILARTVASTAASYAAGIAERLIFGPRKRTVEGPRLEGFQIQSSTEGAPIARLWGRARVAGQIVWAASFKETVAETTESSGGKGGRLAASKTTYKEYLYSLSFAVGLCEGEIDRIARVWADGRPIDLSKVNHRLYRGTEDQTPDDLVAAVEGEAPAFRGLAYIVFEDLPLKDFGNRIPQLSFEIEKSLAEDDPKALENALSAVTIIPGSGEFVYATTKVTRETGEGASVSENVNNNDGVTDFSSSLEALTGAAKSLEAASLVVSWFGDDLRAGTCALRPGVETYDKTTGPDRWTGGGVSRGEAKLVSSVNGRPAYGGTPSDKGVLEAILAMKAKGLAVMMHPFILMDIPEANALPDPEGAGTQKPYPWRGRISVGANEGTAGAAADIAAFFGAAAPSDFTVANGAVAYNGPAEWSFRRMILHYAHLCAAAGGVEAFLLGSELKALTTARDGAGSFPAVAAMKALAADVRSILPSAKISYGADWSEWSGVTKADGRFFHLDPLWADNNVDFVGIDYYPPLADWRDGFAHADFAAGWRSQYDRAYIAANIEGGENFDWHYASEADRAAQVRTPIADAAYGEPWIFRAKDLRSWWRSAHHDRPGFVRAGTPTPWVPKSKPIRFAEFGVPAVDKGANAPNVFVDPKSSESALPPFSSGARDDLAQRRAIEAVLGFWRANNEAEAGVPLIETDRLYVYAFDARPYPFFPARADLWGDAANWEKGHWLNGRLSRAPLDKLVAALAREAGVAVDAALLKGSLAGYVVDRPLSPRQTIDPLADVFQFDMVETETGLRFQPRGGAAALTLDMSALVDPGAGGEGRAAFALTTGQKADLPSAVRLGFIDEGGDYLSAVAEARHPYTEDIREIGIEIAAAMDEASAAARARSILADAAVMRETATFALPPSLLRLEPGDAVKISLAGVEREVRILSIADGAARKVEAARVSPAVYEAPVATSGWKTPAAPPRFGKPAFELMNLPLLREDDDPAAPYLAVYADPWPGAVALYRGEALAATATSRAVLGTLDAGLPPGVSGRWDERTLRVRLVYGALASRSEEEVFAGANAAAVKTADGFEILQFREATLGGDGVWTLKGLLRGQNGTEAEAALGAAAGARFVLLSPAIGQAQLPFDLRGLAFDWRAGPADDLPSEPTFRTKSFTAEARGLRPLAPVHLVAVETEEGLLVSWVRRTRKGGDGWTGEDAPLAEAFERYRVEIWNGETLVRTADVSAPAFIYEAAMIQGDFPPAEFPAGRPPLKIRVAQISDLVGPGAWGEMGA
jgi:hypothetical protein